MSDTLRGQFLIAGCKLRDPNFFKTTILVIEHGADGAMGLVVNRPSSVSVSNALAGHFDLPETGELVFFGGPVEPAALFILHNAPELEPGDPSVLPGLYVASSADVFSHVVQASCNGGGGPHYRVFSGCAGWAPDQLEAELARGDWFAYPARPELVFHHDPYVVWDTLLREVYQSKRLLPFQCDNPEWN